MPELKDAEQLRLTLAQLGDEIRISAQWGEKHEPFQLLQKIPLHAPLKRVKDSLRSAKGGASSRGEQTDRLSQILDTFSSEDFKLDSLPTAPDTPDISADVIQEETSEAGADGKSVVLETDYDEELLSQALSGLSAQLRNDIIKILEDPHVDSNTVSNLIDDLVLNRSVRQIRNTVRGIRIQQTTATGSRTGLRARSQRYHEQDSALGISLRALLASVIVVVLLFAAWRFVYRPISSHILYRNALNAIADDRFQTGEEVFRRARAEHHFRYQLFGIANAYYEAESFERADMYFAQYIEEYPGDIDGFLQYIMFLAYRLGDEERAVALSTRRFEAGETNRDLLRILGDLHLERGDRSATRQRGDYEDANYYYSYIFEKYRADRDSLANLLRYFVRVNDYNEIATATSVLDGEDYQRIRPIALSELIEYFLESGRTEQAEDIIRSVELAEVKYAGVHLQAARYFARVDNVFASEESLRNAEEIFRKYPPETRYEEELFIRLQGNRAAMAAADGDLERALQIYNEAIVRFEDLLENDVVVPRRFFGALYAGRGDIFYTSNNYERALNNYASAQEQLYQSPELDYAVGSIYYRSFDYQQAALLFERIISSTRGEAVSLADKNVLYALSNSFFFMEGYAAALGYYRELITLLERKIDPSLLFITEDDIPHRDITEMLIAVYNNVGVSYARLHQVQSDQGYIDKSIAYLQNASVQYNDYRRGSNVDLIPLTRSLPYRNSFAQLHGNEDELQIYSNLPPALGSPFVSVIDGGVAAASSLSDPRIRHIEFP